jgi:hypothetical protein
MLMLILALDNLLMPDRCNNSISSQLHMLPMWGVFLGPIFDPTSPRRHNNYADKVGVQAYLGSIAILSSGLNSVSEYTIRPLSFFDFFSPPSAGGGALGAPSVGVLAGLIPASAIRISWSISSPCLALATSSSTVDAPPAAGKLGAPGAPGWPG